MVKNRLDLQRREVKKVKKLRGKDLKNAEGRRIGEKPSHPRPILRNSVVVSTLIEANVNI